MTQSAIKVESPHAVNLSLAITTESRIEINIRNKSRESGFIKHGRTSSLEFAMQETFPTTSRGKKNQLRLKPTVCFG